MSQIWDDHNKDMNDQEYRLAFKKASRKLRRRQRLHRLHRALEILGSGGAILLTEPKPKERKS